MKPIACLLTILFAVSPALAQTHLYVDSKGQMFFDVNCAPGRRLIAQTVTTTKTTAELQTLYKQIVGNDALLRQALKHPAPEYRFTGIYAIATKKLAKQDDLIVMLDDAHPSVRLAARQALVVLTVKYGKREDFGPLPGATHEQVAESQSEWRKWFDARRDHVAPKTVGK